MNHTFYHQERRPNEKIAISNGSDPITGVFLLISFFHRIGNCNWIEINKSFGMEKKEQKEIFLLNSHSGYVYLESIWVSIDFSILDFL